MSKSKSKKRNQKQNHKWNHKRNQKINRHLKTHINVRRVIGYLVQLGIVITVYDFLRNHFMFMVLLIVAAAPFLSMLGLFILYRAISFELLVPEAYARKDEVSFLRLRIHNKSILVSYDIHVKLDTENTFYGDMGSTLLSLPCHALGTFEKDLPIRFSMLGSYRFSVAAVTIRDMLGLVNLQKKVNLSTEARVFPSETQAVDMDLSDMSQGMTESEETVKKGHDFSEVSEVREYIPGDKLNSIHWKLTAKRDILMVKDRVSMSDQQMVILTSLAGKPEDVDQVLGLTYAVCRGFVQEQTYLRLLWWSQGKYAFVEKQIMNQENLKEAFSEIYYEKTYGDDLEIRSLMQSIHPELKAYAQISMKNGQADAEVVEQD